MPEISKVTLPSGKREWHGTRGDAKKRAKETGGEWEVINVPTDKQGLLDFVQEVEEYAAYWKPVEVLKGSGLGEIVSAEEGKARLREYAEECTRERVEEVEETIERSDGVIMARFVSNAVCRLGELGEEGRNAVEDHVAAFLPENQGLGVSFYRGSAMLNDIAAFTTGKQRGRKSRWTQ